MFVDAKTALLAFSAAILSACGPPSVVPSRPATEADVRQIQLAEAAVTRGRAVALDRTLSCDARRAGAHTAVDGARDACRIAGQSDDRDLDTRCAAARSGAREARALTASCESRHPS